MRAIVVGTGTIGTAVKKVLQEHGHDVATVGRGSGDFKADISDIESLRSLFATIGSFDAVANAAGDVFPAPLELTTDEQWTQSLRSKGIGQINVVRAALPYITDKGSFTLVSGVLTDEYMHGGTIGTTINHLVEGFVKASAVELPRGIRINCVNERQGMRHLTASIDRSRATSGDLWRLPETARRSRTHKRAQKPRLLELLEAAVLSVGFDNSIEGCLGGWLW